MDIGGHWETTIWACNECGSYFGSADQAASCCGKGALAHEIVHAVQLRGAVEALHGVLSGRIIRDETENGDPILLDLSTDPATVVRLTDLGGQ